MKARPTDREVYPNAPLQFVAWELRTPSIPQFQTPGGVIEKLSGRLNDIVPIVAQPETALVTDTSQPNQPQQQQFRPEQRQRLLDRHQTLSIAVGPTAAVVESSAYTHFEAFEEIVSRVVNAIEAAGSAVGFERIGLRYIDEVRVDGVDSAEDWFPYIEKRLLCRPLLSDARVKGTQSLVDYDRGDNFRVTMRAGALEGRTVDPAGPLRVRNEQSGHYFLLDIDSYWLHPRDEPIPEFDVTRIMEITKELRGPVRELFEVSVTDELRDIFRTVS